MTPIYPSGEFATNPYMSQIEGFGMQYVFIMSAIGYAEQSNKTFLYTPFQAMAHNYDNDPDFLQKKEKLINLIDHFPINQDLDFQKKCIINTPRLFLGSESFKKIRELFFAGKDKQKYFSDHFLNIAIHFRKINPHDTMPLDPEQNEQFYCYLIDRLRLKSVIDQLGVNSASRPLRFHIYSQGNIEQFKAFEADDTCLHINETIEDTFSAMALADILVIGSSYFSNCAAFLSQGLILCTPSKRTPILGIPKEKLNLA